MKAFTERTGRGFSALGWCLSILLVVSVAGCSKEAPTAPDANKPAPAEAAEVQTPSEIEAPVADAAPAEAPAIVTPAPKPNAVVVTVNSEDITESELNDAVDYHVKRAGAQMSSLPPMLLEQFKKQMRQRVLDSLVAERLLVQQIKAANIVVTAEQVLAVIEAQGAKQNPPMTVDQLKQIVEARGGSFEEITEQYKMRLAQQQLMEAQWAGKIDVNEAEVKTYYDENPKAFETPAEVQASHILIKPETADPNADPNEAKVVAKAKAEKLLAEIKGGADFAELAQANSADPGSAARGGDLGFFAAGRMVPPFNDAAFALQPGEMSDIVETQFGYHIIKVTDRKEASVTPFEEAKAGIIEELANQKKSQIAQEYIQSLKDKAAIVYAAGAEPPAPAPVMPAPPAGSSEN